MNYFSNVVLPSGLLSAGVQDELAGYDKTYRNYGLRVGVVTDIYSKKHEKNISKRTTEYDVIVFEQNADSGIVPIKYRNCLSTNGFGSKADFLEFNYRKIKKKTAKGDTPSMSGHNGPLVLLQCVDSMSEKAIIVGGYPHEDRVSKIENDSPQLYGNYNGVSIDVLPDGSTKLIFNGPTDNDGKPLNKDMTPTTLKVESDGSFQVDHSAIVFRMAKDGTFTVTANASINLTAKKDVVVTSTGNTTVTCKDLTATASGNLLAKCKKADIEAEGDCTVEGKNVKLGKGAAQSVIKGEAFKAIYESHVHPTAIGPSGPTTPLPPSVFSKKVKTE